MKSNHPELVGSKTKDRRAGKCPLCRANGSMLTQINGPWYRYHPCGCDVKFTVDGYPRQPNADFFKRWKLDDNKTKDT